MRTGTGTGTGTSTGTGSAQGTGAGTSTPHARALERVFPLGGAARGSGAGPVKQGVRPLRVGLFCVPFWGRNTVRFPARRRLASTVGAHFVRAGNRTVIRPPFRFPRSGWRLGLEIGPMPPASRRPSGSWLDSHSNHQPPKRLDTHSSHQPQTILATWLDPVEVNSHKNKSDELARPLSKSPATGKSDELARQPVKSPATKRILAGSTPIQDTSPRKNLPCLSRPPSPPPHRPPVPLPVYKKQ